MARTRTIKPEFWTDEKLAQVSREARLFFVGLWTVADDQGVTHASPFLLKSQIFPYDNLEIEQVADWIGDFVELGMVIPYQAENGENYLFIKRFPVYQRIDHPSKTQFNPIPREGLAKLSRRSREDYEKTPRQTEYKLNLNRIKTETKVRPLENPEVERLSNLLYQKIIDRNPNHKTPNFKTWCKSIRLMIDSDKRNPEEIETVIEWCQDDEFWQNNILSPEKLRKQYDRLFLQMNSNNSNKLNITQKSILESEARDRERR